MVNLAQQVNRMVNLAKKVNRKVNLEQQVNRTVNLADMGTINTNYSISSIFFWILMEDFTKFRIYFTIKRSRIIPNNSFTIIISLFTLFWLITSGIIKFG